MTSGPAASPLKRSSAAGFASFCHLALTGMPAAVMGDNHACAMPTPAGPHPPTPIVKGSATVLIGGFGTAGIPGELIDGLIAQGAKDLTVVNNNAGNADQGLAALLKAGRVRKIICSFPRQVDSYVTPDRGWVERTLRA